MKRSITWPGRDGYTILEALIGLLVISLMAMPIFRLLTTEKRLSAAARDKASAYFLAVSEMERLKTVQAPAQELMDHEEDSFENGKSFHLVRKVKPRFLEDAENPLREVTVEVYLHERRLAHLQALFGGLAAAPKDTL